MVKSDNKTGNDLDFTGMEAEGIMDVIPILQFPLNIWLEVSNVTKVCTPSLSTFKEEQQWQLSK
jgi:hypothetical protein